jgi:hypothetical protein
VLQLRAFTIVKLLLVDQALLTTYLPMHDSIVHTTIGQVGTVLLVPVRAASAVRYVGNVSTKNPGAVGADARFSV